MFDEIILKIQLLKNGDKSHDFCLDDAINYINKAAEAFDASTLYPTTWRADNLAVANTFIDMFPLIEHTLHTHTLAQVEEGNSPTYPHYNRQV